MTFKYKYKYSKIVFKYSKIQIVFYLTPSLIHVHVNVLWVHHCLCNHSVWIHHFCIQLPGLVYPKTPPLNTMPFCVIGEKHTVSNWFTRVICSLCYLVLPVCRPFILTTKHFKTQHIMLMLSNFGYLNNLWVIKIAEGFLWCGTFNKMPFGGLALLISYTLPAELF